MSLRWKVALAMATLAAATSLVLGVASYRSTSDRLYAEIDRSLLSIDAALGGRPGLPDRGPLAGYGVQIVDADGDVGLTTFDRPLEIDDHAKRAIGSPRVNVFSTVEGDSGDVRVRTVGTNRGAVQITRSLDETERVLTSLRNRTVLFTALITIVASAAGWWIAGHVTAPLRKFTSAAEHVAETGRLDVAVGERGTDEVGRLGTAFDGMLAALARSRAEQQRLVQDAGHELRTPLTSLRTNLDVLHRFPELSVEARDDVVNDLRAETDELTDLVNEIVAVAAGAASDEPDSEFDLVELAAEVADRYERRTGRDVAVLGATSVVTAQRAGVQRAMSCLVDNACKFDDSDAPIQISVEGQSVVVADHGPGIPDDALESVFERFHRADEARTRSGSGLGLSIVREVARRHGGDAFARNREGGGAEVGFRLG